MKYLYIQLLFMLNKIIYIICIIIIIIIVLKERKESNGGWHSGIQIIKIILKKPESNRS